MQHYLTLYKASAGSGKTHMLTREYLKLAFEAPEKFMQILAVTFTNKAAGEMKDRIIDELESIIKNGEQAAHFEAVSIRYPEMSTGALEKRARHILDQILHNYTRFSVSTIDSFVQRTVRAFSYEIGVQSGYKIELDQSKVIHELTQMLYEYLDENPELYDWLVKFARYRIHAGKNWDFRTDILGLANEIFKERFQNFAEQVRRVGADESRKMLNTLHTQLLDIRYGFENRMRELSVQAKSLLESSGLLLDFSSRTTFGQIANYLLSKITDGKFEPTATILKAIDSNENWTAKSTPEPLKQRVAELYPALSALLAEAVQNYTANYRSYISAVKTLDNFHAFGILNDLSSLLPEYRDENNLMLLSDTTLLLREIIKGNDAPFVYERIGNRYKHILIDEFQDTSGFQWENFYPLIRNSLAEGEANLIVGDIKQSIYRWRGGDWNLLLNKVTQDIGKQYIKDETLDTNWRSLENIIDFNNAVFAYTPLLLQEDFTAQLHTLTDEAIRRNLFDRKFDSILVDAYADSYQHLSSDKNKGGLVDLRFARVPPKDVGKKWRTFVDENLPALINELLTTKGYQPKDITLLVRKNSEAQAIVNLLLDYTEQNPDAVKYPIISAESLYISRSRSVSLLISALKYLFSPGDSIQLANLLYNYHAVISLDFDEAKLHTLFFSGDKQTENLHAFMPKSFVENMDRYKILPLYELCETLIQDFSLHNNTSETPYLRAFLDTVLDFSRNEVADLHKFIEWWDERGLLTSLQLSEDQDAVKVMTIHKSKGLAFKVVIVPYCDWKLESSTGVNAPIIWCQTHEEPYMQFDYLPVRYDSKLSDSVYSMQYFEEKLYGYMDSLNTLYVALTRAEDVLYIMAPLSEKSTDKKISSIADLLHAAVEYVPSQEGRVKVLKQYYDVETAQLKIDDNLKANSVATDKQEKKYNLFNPGPLQFSQWRNKLFIHEHSTGFFIESIDYIAERVQYGTLMHHIFAKIKNTDDADGVLLEMYFQGKISFEERDLLKTQVIEILKRPSVQPWFSSQWKVRTECALLTPDGTIRIPDRLLTKGKEAIVIDFKFGKPHPEHVDQVNEYKKLVVDLGFPNVNGYIYYAYEDQTIHV